MDKYYHFTSYDCLESISKSGLVPQTGKRCKSINDNRCAVFLSEGIENTILIYTSLLWHYMQYGGDNGLKQIEKYKKMIKSYLKEAEELEKQAEGLEEQVYERINALKLQIENIEPMTRCKDFNDYINDGCYLSVSGVSGIISENPEDCYYNKIIPPSKINVVVIKNRKTDELIDSRESVLAYFMSNFTPADLVDNIPNVITRKIITDLYQDRFDDIYLEYNNLNYILEEIPIKSYDHTYKKSLVRK